MPDTERRTTTYSKTCKSCEQCRLRKVRCIVTQEDPSRCKHCTKRNEECDFRQIRRKFKAQPQTTTTHNPILPSPSQHSLVLHRSRSNHTQTPQNIKSLFVDHLLDSSPSGVQLSDEACVFRLQEHEAYFRHVHSIYPFLDKQRFERTAFGPDIARKLSSDAAFSALYHAVLALGCQYRDGGSFDPGKGKAWKLFQISLGLMADILAPEESLLKLQALTAMSIFAMNTCCLQIDELLVREAARMAQSLRYHRSSHHGDQQICRQRTFWVIYIMEKQLVFQNRVSSIIVDFDIGCPFPDTPEAIFGGCNWFLLRVRFARITSQAYELLFSISASVNTVESYYSAIDYIQDRLERWKMTLPEDFRPGAHKSYTFSDPAFRMILLQTHYLYYSLVIALARLVIQVSPEKGQRREDSKIKLMESARHIIELTQYIEKAAHTPISILGVIPLVALFILFDFVVHNPLHPETKTNLFMMDIASGHFNLVEHASNGSLPSSGVSEFSHIARQYVRDFPANSAQERTGDQGPTQNSTNGRIVPMSNQKNPSDPKSSSLTDPADPMHIPVNSDVDVDADFGLYGQIGDWSDPTDYLYYPAVDFNVDIDDSPLHGFDVRTLFGSSFEKPTRRLLPSPDKNLRLYEHLSKPHTSIIIQVRTMRMGLRHFLCKIKQVDSHRCSRDLGSQTPRHVLLQCSLHITGRRIMMDHLDQIEGLRGRTQDYDAVIAHPQAIRYVAQFMHRTGLLQQFRFAQLNEDDEEKAPEPSTLLEGLELGEEDDGYTEL
ncbi:Zn(II)2Cys6 transcription factor [Aspergillus affinis]|uniref:Zn(II)2Cys6 transcription factor n=1 Tax=Aspergillus affinis TaxID=1070780 RepID=UPI0022FEB6FF|nr:uncharacterized protein KD926_008869 [Aspergillus affinis]KAI9045442.1 hypothetical protein KD926_008869 [Aspergillus affinis]